MKQIAFYEALDFNPVTGNIDLWKGTATLATIIKNGLRADLSYVLCGDESWAIDGRACGAA